MKSLTTQSRLVSVLLVLASILVPQVIRAGSVARLYYDGLSTSSSVGSFRIGLASLTNSTKFPNIPSFREQLDDFTSLPGVPLRAGLQGKDNSGNDYGSYIRGYLEAPQTGSYLFNIASDDNSALFLSTDHTEANKRRIAYETDSGAPLFGGPRQDVRLSGPINLVRGQKYYFEVLHKQGGGGSYIQVGWQRPDGVQEIIPALHLAQYPIDPFLGFGQESLPPTLNTRGLNGGNLPAAATIAEGNTLLLELDIIAAQPTSFRWTLDGVEIPGENLSFLRIPRASAALNGKKVVATVSNPFGTLTSATTTLTVSPDTTAPSVLLVETAGNPNRLRVTFSEPVDPVTATNLANYEVRVSGGTALTIQGGSLTSDGQTVELAGSFNFQPVVNYQFVVRNLRDQAVAPNALAPNPTTRSFTFTAPTGTTYAFNEGRPSGFRFFGVADVVSSGSHDGSGFLQLTDSFRNRNSAVLVEERRDVDQVRLRFKARFSDGGTTESAPLDSPGDGFSVNIAGDLPLGTLPAPEEGFTPDVPGNRISFTFDSHLDSSQDEPSIGVLFNNQVLTNILVGIDGQPRNGVPSITSTDGRWVEIDIDLRRNGLLTLRFGGVTVIDQLPTPFEIIRNAQINFAARTRSWFQTHWIDDLNINFGEGDIGNAGLSPDSILGGEFTEGSEVRLSALPIGAGPFSYQWFKNGSPLVGETSRFLRFPALPGSGGTFSVKVSNAFSEFTSESRLVTVRPDTDAPELVSIRGLAGGVNRIELLFDEELDPVTATDPASYSSSLFRVRSAVLGLDGKSVTLETTPQRVGITYPLRISGLRDRSANANALVSETSFTSFITYAEEVLADRPTRFYRLNETAGTVAFTQVTSGDRVNTNGAYINLPVLGVPGLVPSDPENRAARFVRANTNYIAVPNGGDINDLRGPWSQKSFEFWFRAFSTPAPGTTSLPANTAGLFEEGGGQRSIHLHLWRDPAKQDPAESELVFHAFNDGPDGPGAPFGIRVYDPVYVKHTIRTNVTYHVIGVFDGRTDSRDGELRLYVNAELVARSTNGVGQIYNHNGDVRIGSGNARTFFNVSAAFGSFDGIIDDVSLYNQVLTDERIRAHYEAGIGSSLTATNLPVRIVALEPGGHPDRLHVVFNQPVSQQTATNLANYTLATAGGVAIPIQSAQLQADLVTVRLEGSFRFSVGSTYRITAQRVADILAPENILDLTTQEFSFTSDGPVGVGSSSDLGNRQVADNGSVQFSVVPTGQAPFTYQWNFNGSPIAGATSSILALEAPLTAAGEYSVTVRNEFSTTTSASVRLTVVPDTGAPRLLSARALAGSLNEIVLTFDERLDATTATSIATYGVTGLSLSGASLSEDGRVVTLTTSPQTHGAAYRVSIQGLRDRAASPNVLATSVTPVSVVSYRDEILYEAPVRYWPLNETSGESLLSLTTGFDLNPENFVGRITNTPALGQASLVPNLPGDPAIGFRADSGNYLLLPNGRDINALLGPWAKRTHLFHFRADKLPRVLGTNGVEAPGLYGHDRIGIYLYGTQNTNSPTEALLIFVAHNSDSEGPGTPWGGLSNNPDTSKFVAVPVQAGKVYQVAAVLDGSATTFTGQLRLYLDGEPVGSVGGIGQIYKHPNSRIGIGSAPFRRHDGINTSLDPTSSNRNQRFEGVIDEFAILDRALSADRIAQLYQFSKVIPPESPVGAGRITGVRLQGTQVEIIWEGEGSLQRADRLEGPYQTLPGATNPYSEPSGSASQRFFRLAR